MSANAVLDLVRPDLRDLAGYSSARMESTRDGILLNANESPWPQRIDLPLNRYPDPQPAELRARLAAIYGVDSEQLLMGRGSDELIDLLVRALCAAGEHAIAVHAPTFGMYAVAAAVQGARVVDVSRNGSSCIEATRPDHWLDALDRRVRIVFVCSPNNPTGALTDPVNILSLARALEGRALVVVDEAYIEFSSTAGLACHVKSQANLAVLRTLSKAHALASARIGCLIAAPSLVELLRRMMAPYPLPGPCVDAALAATTPDRLAATRNRVRTLVEERQRMYESLISVAGVVDVLPSSANFLCVRFADPDAVLSALALDGIVVRDVRRHPTLGDALRISIGTPDENARVMHVLQRLPEMCGAKTSAGVRA